MQLPGSGAWTLIVVVRETVGPPALLQFNWKVITLLLGVFAGIEIA